MPQQLKRVVRERAFAGPAERIYVVLSKKRKMLTQKSVRQKSANFAAGAVFWDKMAWPAP
eukprot:scaffold50834_cov102-Phaeocystis_antarctica.AAC.2